MNITTLGEARFASPQRRTVSDQARVSSRLIRDPDAAPAEELLFELAGPRARLFFDPPRTRAGIVTCGGLCPGLNNVIRSLFLELHHGYGVKEVLGFRGGYQGLDPATGREPLMLTPEVLNRIHHIGGTVLGTSRGPVDVGAAVDNLIRRGVNILFTLGATAPSAAAMHCSRKPGVAGTRWRWSAFRRPSTTTWPSSRAASAT